MRVYNAKIATTAGVTTAIPTNATISLAANQLYDVFGFCIQAVITGTPTGSFKLQASADPCSQGSLSTPLTGQAPTNWTDISNSSQSVSAAGTVIFNVSDVHYNWVRVVYTDTSGGASTATFTARINVKAY